MATAKQRLGAPGVGPTAEDLDELGYGELVAAWADADERWSGPDPHLVKFRAGRAEYEAIVARLEELGESDTSVVRAVAAALARPRALRRLPGHLDHAEAAMCLAAHRRATYLSTTGVRSRGPFASLHHHPTTETP